MGYRIEGLKAEAFAPLFGLSDSALAERGAVRVIADSETGYPCRIALDHVRPGETAILLNHVSNDVDGPFRTAYAIYVREGAEAAPVLEDRLPPVLQGRMLSLRGFDSAGMLRSALLTGEAEEGIHALLDDPAVASIHAHSAAYGCFLARIGRA
jgi:hypothetical protein